MNAEDVLVSALRGAWRRDFGPTRLAEVAVADLRAACGGGPVVILDDGTLATIAAAPFSDLLFGPSMHAPRWVVVPVDAPTGGDA